MTKTTSSPKELLLTYKLVSSSFHISFYFLLTLVTVLTAIFSARIYDTNLYLKDAFGATLPQYITLSFGIPVGLALWRYHVNRAKRKEAASALFEEIGTQTTPHIKTISLAKEASKKTFAVLLRIRIQIAIIAIIGSYFLLSRLSTNAEITGIVWFYVSIIIVSIVTVLVVSIFANRATRNELDKLSNIIDSDNNTASPESLKE